MAKLNSKRFLTLAVILLGITQCFQTDAELKVCIDDRLPPHPSCQECRAVGCVWCRTAWTIAAYPSEEKTLPFGVCMPLGDTCTTVSQSDEPWVAEVAGMFGAYKTDYISGPSSGGAITHTTSVRYTPDNECSQHPNYSSHVIVPAEAAGNGNCEKCISSSGTYCVSVLGVDASLSKKSARLCLADSSACGDERVEPIYWLESWKAVTVAQCSSGQPSYCPTYNVCRDCSLFSDGCKWCQPKVVDDADNKVGSLLSKFGKCVFSDEICADITSYEGLKSVADTSFGDHHATTFGIDEFNTEGACAANIQTDFIHSADFTTCKKCMAGGFVWCQLKLIEGFVEASTIGGVCAIDGARCQKYTDTSTAGYTLIAAALPVCTEN